MPRLLRIVALIVATLAAVILVTGLAERSAPAHTPADVGASLIADVVYDVLGEPEHEAHRLDVYLPTDTAGPVPAVVWIHGGGWIGGDKSDPMGPWDWTEDGVAVVAVNYRLAPEATVADAVTDVRAAIAHIRSSAGLWGIDPDRIGVYGHSAGGHLAAMVAAGDEPVVGVVAAGAPLDLVSLLDADDAQFVGLVGEDLVDFMVEVLGCSTPDAACRAAARRVSPALLPSDDTPVLVVHGGDDRFVPVDQARAYAEAHSDAPRITVLVDPDAGHDFFEDEASEFMLARLHG